MKVKINNQLNYELSTNIYQGNTKYLYRIYKGNKKVMTIELDYIVCETRELEILYHNNRNSMIPY